MNFNAHSELIGKHAFLGASQHAWLNYTKDKLVDRYATARAKEEGTELHELAAMCIRKRLKAADAQRTLYMYINDAIGYGLTPEQPLFYSKYCFGTADTIGYFEKEKILRIHDLKTGKTPSSMVQLRVYAALFFLEYGAKYGITPTDVYTELRIYQNNAVEVEVADPAAIRDIMNKIIHGDIILRELEGDI